VPPLVAAPPVPSSVAAGSAEHARRKRPKLERVSVAEIEEASVMILIM
jgi:hypothetical protein